MDTGNYMANQMSDQIEASQHLYDEFCTELENDITEFIKQSGYDWDCHEIILEYLTKYRKGCYVSYTCKKVILQFEDRLKNLL